MREPLKVRRAPLMDEGATAAVYPYVQLREILNPVDCRHAIIDETNQLEREFGLAIVEPLYELIWTLNCGAGIFTSHTAVAPRDQQPPYAWAENYVAVAIVMLSRDRTGHFSQDACIDTVDQLGRIVSARAPTRDSTGWYVSVGPCNVIFTPEMDLTTFRSHLLADTKGFGIEMRIGGAANNRHIAAARWSNTVSFITSTLRSIQHGENTIPAAPHRHTIPGALLTE